MSKILSTHNLTSFYGDFQAIFGIDFDIFEGEAIAIIGANGAGKSTFLKTLTGLISCADDAVMFEGDNIGGMNAFNIAKKGLIMVPEGRRLFPSLSVEENLLMGAEVGRSGYWNLETVFELFPILEERRNSPGTALSGGQQQMVAIGRGLMSNPRLLLLDEISLGLAPVIIKDIYDALPKIRELGISVVIVEQDIKQALKVADRVYCFQEGRVSLNGKPKDFTKAQITEAYFGV
ncbi:MAG: ABC transporter ATP-binding protein [Alphaproteobacteria bacterium]|nr:ABC transporter ATP-binding protein [Alphaproteobacteria bacterium]